MVEKEVKNFIAFNEEFKEEVLNKVDVEEMLKDFGSLLSKYIDKLGLMKNETL